jgi:hypothetical protein
LTFNVSGENGTHGFCRVFIPDALIDHNQLWTIKLDGEYIDDWFISNWTHWVTWPSYSHSIHQIEIVGVTTIPEFPTFLIPSLLMLVTLLAIIVYKRRHPT